VAARNFEGDDAKAASNYAKHKISFEAAVAVFGDPEVVIVTATRKRDGEERFRAIGAIEGRVFTARMRLISARRSNRREEGAYGAG
jgi:uncharacterized DUF497 family protein